MTTYSWMLTLGLALPLCLPLAAQTPGTPFQAGDRIFLKVEGDSALSDTFTVVTGPAVRLPEIGEISLAGIPRSDLESHMTRELGRYLNDLVLADALMVAGGATKDARVDQLRIFRGDAPLWSGSQLQAQIARGATLDQLGMKAGDRIQVPSKPDPESKWRITGLIVTSFAAAVGILALTR